MKLLKLFITFCLISNLSFSQEINWGPTYSKKFEDPMYFSSEKDFIVAYFVGWTLNIEKINKKDYSKIYSVKHKISTKDDYLGLSYINNNILIFKRTFDKKNKKDIFYAEVFSGDTGEKSKDRKIIQSINTDKKTERGSLIFRITQDYKKILVIHDNYDWKKETGFTTKYKLFDDQFNIISERDVFRGKNEEIDNTLALNVAADGSTYELKMKKDGSMYIKCLEAKKDFEKWEEPLDFKKLGLPLKSVIKRIHLIIDANGDYKIIGYYSENSETFDGLFFLKMDHISKNILAFKVNEFDEKLKKKLLDKDSDTEIKKDYNNIKFFTKEDGGFVIVAEEFYLTYGQNNEPTHKIKDMIIFNISNDGTILWADKIDKKQYFHYSVLKFGKIAYGQYFSFTGYFNKNEFVLLYNDNPKNYKENSNPKNPKMLRNPPKSVVVAKKFNLETGVLTTQVVERNKKLVFSPVYSPGDEYMCSFKGKKHRFGSIKK